VTNEALIDSNVLVAALAVAHQHHGPSSALLANAQPNRFAVAAHSYAGAYTTLTRRGERAPFQFTADEAWEALESVRALTNLVGLTDHQTFGAIRTYARGGGIGARLYDHLIGEVAVAHAIQTIVTWNVAHMGSLFPDLVVTTPVDFS